jgi:hypothetical protein
MEYWSKKVFELLIQNSRFKIPKSTNDSYLDFVLWIFLPTAYCQLFLEMASGLVTSIQFKNMHFKIL